MTRHVLSLSGGKDSAALAVYLRDRVPEMEYVFHDTGKELPETYDYIARLESILGRPIAITTPEDTFEHWLAVFGDMLPSNHRRWCTKMLKLKPFEAYIGDDPTINYVGLRADEKRTGYISTKPNITAVYPFQEDGVIRADVIRILQDSGLGLPPYMEWGRSRSGCYFCFYQQKIEWVRLKRTHPDLYERAKQYEERSARVSDGFTWCSRESLTELEQPDRMAEIERNWEVSRSRRAGRRENLPLAAVLAGAEVEEDELQGCLICSL
jgi:3'-phosphoadenosine 5'-phosphosulfate sulfotransferase (PAPS reductase)/FAD synthetase